VGVDHHVEPPSWRPEGAASAVTEEPAPGPADAAAEQESPSGEQESPNGVHDLNGAGGDPKPEDADPSPAASDTATLNGGQESPEPDEDPISYSKDDSFSYEQPGPDESSYTVDYPAAQSGYNDGMSQSGYSDGLSPPLGGESSVPPYPAELPSQQPAAASSPVGTVAATQALPKPRPKSSQKTEGRRANLVIARLEPWSVMKFSFLMSLVAWVVLFVAVTLLYYALSGLGVFDAIQRTLSSVTSSQSSAGVNVASWTSASRVLGYTMLIGAVDIVLITALSTIGAVIYNLVTHLGGGIEVTLKETD
jgi:Transmembrane domain of unknown function (DUF3566)